MIRIHMRSFCLSQIYPTGYHSNNSDNDNDGRHGIGIGTDNCNDDNNK